MMLQTMLLAEHAAYDAGCFSVLRGGWDTTAVTADPKLKAYLVLRLLFADGDADAPHRLEIACKADEPPTPVFSVDQEISGTRPDGFPVNWEFPVDLVIRLEGALPGVGNYEISVHVDGDFVGKLHFRAISAPSPAKTG